METANNMRTRTVYSFMPRIGRVQSVTGIYHAMFELDAGPRQLSSVSGLPYSIDYNPRNYDRIKNQSHQHGQLRMMENGVFTSYPCPFESKRWMCMDIDDNDIYISTDTDLLIFRDGEYTKIAETTSWKEGDQTTAVANINTFKAPAGNATTYDLQGRQLQDKPEHGMYIQDGRKVVIK